MRRRDFLFAFAALPVLIRARAAGGAPRVIGAAWGAGARGGRTARGLRFGIDEARRTSGLLGRDIQWVEREGEGSLDALVRARAELIIAVGDVGRVPPGSPPILRLPADGRDVGECGPNEWSVAPSAEQKAAVVREFRSRAGNGQREVSVVAWHPALEKYGAAQLNERYRTATHELMEENAWLGWFAAKVALEAVLRGPALATLKRAGFGVDGHKGTALSFDALQRRLQQPLYVVDARSPGGAPLAEITPAASPAACALPKVPPPR